MIALEPATGSRSESTQFGAVASRLVLDFARLEESLFERRGLGWLGSHLV